MSRELRFFVLALPNTSWDELLRRFQLIEELGFDLAGTADHFVDWSNPPSPWFDSWTFLAAIARETTRIRLAPYVAQIPLREPAMLARQAITLDHISGGRLDVGLGIGLEMDPSYNIMGIPNWSVKERVARFKEYVEIVDHMLSNEVTTYQGKFYQVNDAHMNPRPLQKPRPPIVIGAMGPVMLRHTVRFADTWNSISFAATFEEQLEETRGRIAKVDALCAELGRDPASLRRSYLMFDPGARTSGDLFSYYQSEAVFEEMVQRVVELGITDIGLYYPIQEEQLPMFETIARDVIPELRAGPAAS
jgi:alkanesulfonate monooxygenase SsuD/methylene tetrahydromethanopterin reductase-like flavin-dependent oxidoreductase (luciferase family)